jgi:hypothetical protein
MFKQIEMAEELADLITQDYEDELTAQDLLDYLASLGFKLEIDSTGVSKAAYVESLKQ